MPALVATAIAVAIIRPRVVARNREE